jgi:hypothetical protein
LSNGNTVNVSSNGGITAYSSATVTLGTSVTAVNDAPLLSGLDATSVNATFAVPYVQGGSAVVIDPNATLIDQELSIERNNWNGATLSISRSGGASSHDLFAASGNLASIASASGSIILSATTIGTYTNSSGTLTLTFTSSNATAARVNELLQSITYSNSQTTAGSLNYNTVDLVVTINDQNSNITAGGTAGSTAGKQDQGNGGILSGSATIRINIDRLPVVNPDTASVSEGVATTDATSVSGNLITGGTAGYLKSLGAMYGR